MGHPMQAAIPFLAPFLMPVSKGAGMSTTAQGISAYILKDLVRKLSPAKFPGIPPTLAALAGFVLGATFGRPHITGVVVADSGMVLARANTDTDAKRVLGSYSDILRNWMRLISRAGLCSAEVMAAHSLFAAKVGFPGPTDA
jgi:hypothetical protein